MSDAAVAEQPAKTTSGQSPVAKYKAGRISAAVFENERSTQEGKVFPAKSVSLKKSWKVSEGQYDERTISLDRDEIMGVITVLQQAFVAMHEDQNS